MKILRVVVVGIAFLAASSGTLSRGQLAQPQPLQSQQPPMPGQPGVEVPPMGPPLSPQAQEQQARMRNNDRQKRLVEDTNKLLVLATELKQDVDKTNKDVLSVDVIKKADEIEKLAHSVKERMKG